MTELSNEAKEVLFNKATERAFTGALLNEKRKGTFVCINCGNKLFDSANKYDSGSGWPSFDREIEGSTKQQADSSHAMIRIEVTCKNCGGHLGHVFDDGPSHTTGKRYCINSVALDFKETE